MAEVIDFPEKIYLGDSIDVTASLSLYSAADGWSVSLVIVNASARYQIDSSADGASHSLDETAENTANYSAGSYKWVAFAIKGAERIPVSSGDVEICADILSGNADLRTHAEKVLAAIESVMENKATTDDLATNVRGKSLQRYSYDELLRLRNFYREEVRIEKRNRKIRQGQTGSRQRRVKF